MYKKIKLLILSVAIVFLLCSCGQAEESSLENTIDPYISQDRSQITEESSDVTNQEKKNAIILDGSREKTLPSSEPIEDITACPDCNGEGRIGTCENCQGTGYDKKTKQICVKCLHTGKTRCERCDGYGMIDSNGKGTSGVSNSRSQDVELPATNNYPHHSSECWYCHGNGLCDNCGGTGRYAYNPEYAGDYCRTCDGTGRCPGCNGKGIVN